MSVEASQTMSDAWTSWQGHVINGAFRLRRFLGSSDHSAVFLSDFTARAGAEVALKLVPAAATRSAVQLADWRSAAGLAHPHLLRLLGTGECELSDRAYLYVVMEYAEQNLGQLLRHRALTESEAREMLQPALQALAFLHSHNMVQGQVKPANLLAVGDQLKLASDTIRGITEAGAGRNTVSVYDPPEAQDGSYSTAGDVWGLGVTLFEALTRSAPLNVDERTAASVLPHEFSPALRELVTACLSRRPYDRPKVAEIESWLRRQAVGASAPSPAAKSAEPTSAEGVPPAPVSPDPQPHAQVSPKPASPGAVPSGRVAAEPAAVRAPATLPSSSSAPNTPAAVARPERRASAPAAPYQGGIVHARPSPTLPPAALAAPAETQAAAPQGQADGGIRWPSLDLRSTWPMVLAGVAALVLAWAGVRMLGHHAAAPAVAQSSAVPPAAVAAPPAAVTAPVAPPLSSSKAKPGQTKADSRTAVHEEIPSVPQRARRTIHGHIRVSVRVIVDADGSVSAALVDRPGPSRYFERLAIEAAKKWTFPPAADEPRRLKLVHFEFSRDGATGHAVSLR